MMRRHALVWAVLAAMVASASADAESDYWTKWRAEHGDEEFGGPWEFTDYVKIEPVGPAIAGEPVTVRASARFRQQPGCYPPARVKARVFWNANPGTELLSDAIVETYVGPNDTLDARAVIQGDGGLSVCARVYLYYVVGGVPVMDPRRFASAPKDYWWYAGWGCGDLHPNPLNPTELVSQDEVDRIRQGIRQAFKDRLAGARAGTVAASEEARAVIDSLLPMVDEPTRRQLGVVCDYLGGKTKTPSRDAALFVGKQISVWARGKEYAWMGGSEQAVAEWAVGAAERGMLEAAYSTVVAAKREPDVPRLE